MATANYNNCAVATARVTHTANPCQVVWNLDGLNDPTTRRILITHSKLNLEVGGGEFDYSLEFNLNTYTKNEENEYRGEYLILQATMHSATKEVPASFDIQVDSLEESTPPVNIPSTYTCMKTNGKPTVVGKLMKLRSHKLFRSERTETDHGDQISKSFRIGITVTTIICNFASETIVKNGLTLSPTNLTNSSALLSNLQALSIDFQKVYLDGQDNYADLKLESKDRAIISAHKFVLAARCPTFKELIDMAMKQNEFDGTIMITEVNAKPLMAILHWMYSGNLPNGTEKYLEELIAAAVKYEMRELLGLLDKELIKICNKGNMLQLLMMAQKNEMEFAIKQISKYIKENL